MCVVMSVDGCSNIGVRFILVLGSAVQIQGFDNVHVQLVPELQQHVRCAPPLSLPLSHTHTHSHTLSHSLSLSRARALSLSLSHTKTRCTPARDPCCTLSLSRACALSLAHTQRLSISLTHTHPAACTVPEGPCDGTSPRTRATGGDVVFSEVVRCCCDPHENPVYRATSFIRNRPPP